MPRNEAIIFVIGKLDTFRVDCPKCGRAGRYKLPVLVGQYGCAGSVIEFLAEIAVDCPRRLRASDYDACAAHCPDLPKVL